MIPPEEKRKDFEIDRRVGPPDRREDNCPVCKIVFRDLNRTDTEVKKKLPIWVFLAGVAIIGSVNGYLIKQMNTHIDKSNQLIETLIHAQNETALNQQRIMSKLGMEYRELKKRW